MNMEEKSYGAIAAMVGLVVGLIFGVLVMMSGAWSALAVLTFGALGAVFAYVVFGVMTGSLDFGGAWRALRRK
jgi:hypothetical protein